MPQSFCYNIYYRRTSLMTALNRLQTAPVYECRYVAMHVPVCVCVFLSPVLMCAHNTNAFLLFSQAGQVMCRRMVCDCDNPNADLFCCPECDPRLSSQCLHQNGLLTYGSGDTWVENCQQCQCLVGSGMYRCTSCSASPTYYATRAAD